MGGPGKLMYASMSEALLADSTMVLQGESAASEPVDDADVHFVTDLATVSPTIVYTRDSHLPMSKLGFSVYQSLSESIRVCQRVCQSPVKRLVN